MPSPDPSQGCAERRALTLAEQLDAEMAEMNERHLRNLVELAETGMAVQRAVGRRAGELEAVTDGQDHASALNDLGLTVNRVVRAVRLAMTLEAQIRETRRARLQGLEADEVARSRRAPRPSASACRKSSIISSCWLTKRSRPKSPTATA